MINNLPTYANEYKYIVARRVDGELWFWGAWNDLNKANEVALEIGGEVVTNKWPPNKKVLKKGLTKTGTSAIIKSSKERKLKQ